MKNISFKKISIKNFLSIGETPVEINFKSGVNFITGENLDVPETKNAIGKTTITQAFNFAIFGNSLKNLTKDQMVNNITKGKTEVILSFRCESPKGNNDFVIVDWKVFNTSAFFCEGPSNTNAKSKGLAFGDACNFFCAVPASVIAYETPLKAKKHKKLSTKLVSFLIFILSTSQLKIN